MSAKLIIGHVADWSQLPQGMITAPLEIKGAKWGMVTGPNLTFLSFLFWKRAFNPEIELIQKSWDRECIAELQGAGVQLQYLYLKLDTGKLKKLF